MIEEYDDMEEFIEDKVDNNILNDKINIIKQKLGNNDDNEYIIKIANFIICLLKNKKQLFRYKSSKADLFFEKFMNEIHTAQENNSKNKLTKFSGYLILLLFRLFYINDLCINDQRLNDYKTNIKTKIDIIESESKDIEKRINRMFESRLRTIDEYQENAIELISNEVEMSNEEIIERLKSLNYENRINDMMRRLDNDINNIQIDYYFFCMQKITEIINDLTEFQGTLDIISYNLNRDLQINNYLKKGIFFIWASGVFSSSTKAILMAWYSLSLMPVFAYAFLYIPIIYVSYKFFDLCLEYKNDKKIKIYFFEIKKHIDKIKKKYLESTKRQKEQYILELKKSKNITLDEIKYLKNINYQDKLQDLITLFH